METGQFLRSHFGGFFYIQSKVTFYYQLWNSLQNSHFIQINKLLYIETDSCSKTYFSILVFGYYTTVGQIQHEGGEECETRVIGLY